MRATLRQLSAEGQARLRTTHGVLVQLEPVEGPCRTCGDRMQVQKTWVRGGVCLSLGCVQIRQTVQVCASGCPRGADTVSLGTLPGQYLLQVGLYDPATLRPLPILSSAEGEVRETVTLQPLSVENSE